ncbi:MAG: oligosaccharide flippase family protein [Clostridia bacterium]|nr:oligosaccharide flippase family protein [Clostridia bacterium]
MNKLKQKYKALSIEAKAALWFAVCNFLNKGISMIVVPLYTHLLAVEEYGSYTVFQSWLDVLLILVTLEISRGHYKVGITNYDSDVDRYTTSVLGLSNAVTVVYTALYLCFIPVFNKILGMPTHIVISMLIYLLVYPAWEFWAIRQRFAYKYKTMIAATLSISVLTPVIGILGILLLNLQSPAAIYSRIGVQGIAAIFVYFGFLKKDRHLFVKEYWKKVFVFNIILIPYLLSTTVLNQADRIMINNMVGSAEAGIYSVAYAIAMLMQLINYAINDAFLPWMYRQLKNKQYKEIEPVTDKILLLVAAANILVILFAPEVLAVFAPPKYYAALKIIPPVTASVFFMFIFQRYISVEAYYEATARISIISILVAILNIILNYFCIKQWGYLAAGYTTLACYIVFAVAHYFSVKQICRKKCGTKVFTAGVTLVFSIAFLALVFLLTSLYNYRIIRYVLALVLFGIAFYKRNFIKQLFENRNAA